MNIKNLHRILQNNPSLNIFWYNSGDILKTCWHITYITIRQVPVSEPARTFWKVVGMSAASPSDKAQCQQNQVLNLISWIFSDQLSSLPLDKIYKMYTKIYIFQVTRWVCQPPLHLRFARRSSQQRFGLSSTRSRRSRKKPSSLMILVSLWWYWSSLMILVSLY